MELHVILSHDDYHAVLAFYNGECEHIRIVKCYWSK
jgi:hypothetical protein